MGILERCNVAFGPHAVRWSSWCCICCISVALCMQASVNGAYMFLNLLLRVNVSGRVRVSATFIIFESNGKHPKLFCSNTDQKCLNDTRELCIRKLRKSQANINMMLHPKGQRNTAYVASAQVSRKKGSRAHAMQSSHCFLPHSKNGLQIMLQMRERCFFGNQAREQGCQG